MSFVLDELNRSVGDALAAVDSATTARAGLFSDIDKLNQRLELLENAASTTPAPAEESAAESTAE
jgi:hypothetical protein